MNVLAVRIIYTKEEKGIIPITIAFAIYKGTLSKYRKKIVYTEEIL